MKEFLSFLKSKTFFKHFGLAVILLCLVLFLFFKLLAVYTNHGEMVEVPDFKGQYINQLDNFVKGKNIRYRIIDSIYSPGEKPGVVLKQDPEPKVNVKHNRTVYLYVTSQLPPQIEMPKLVDRSLRQALATIESYELKVGSIKKIAGECNGCVLKQLVDGKEIKEKTLIKKGTKIQLVIGEGEANERVVVPGLIGETLKDAMAKLTNNGLTVGGIVPDERSKDSLNMFVYKQEPAATADATIRVGGTVILYLTKDKSKINN